MHPERIIIFAIGHLYSTICPIFFTVSSSQSAKTIALPYIFYSLAGTGGIKSSGLNNTPFSSLSAFIWYSIFYNLTPNYLHTNNADTYSHPTNDAKNNSTGLAYSFNPPIYLGASVPILKEVFRG